MYDRILAEFYGTPWGLLPSKYAAVSAFLKAKARGEHIPEMKAAAPRKPQLVANAVAVIPVYGILAKRMNMIMEFSGGTSYDMLLGAIRHAQADNDVRAIVGDFETPGGAVPGLPEAWEEIMKMRGNKPMVACVNTQAASAGLYLASAFDEIIITTSGGMGSLGCCAEWCGIEKALEMEGLAPRLFISAVSPFKGEFSQYSPLSSEAEAELQRMVDMEGERFVEAVAKGRGMPAKKVASDFGMGRMVEAKRAVTAGMADRVGTMEDTLRKLLGRSGKSAGMRAEDLPVELYAADEPVEVAAEAAETEAAPIESEPPPPAHLEDLRRRELELKLAEMGR